MFDPKFFDEISSRLSDVLPSNLHSMKQDMEKNFKAILQSGFAKMDLVTREEFEVQRAVLAKTRQKLEELERVVTEMEKNTETT